MKSTQIRDLIYILTLKEIKTRYKNNVLGYFWSLMNPLAYALIFYFAFGIIFRFKMENYALFLICGLFPWQWLNNSAVTSANVFLSNANLIKKAIFPRYIVAVASCLQEGFHFLMTIPIILLFMMVFDVRISSMLLLAVPVLLLIQFLMVIGLSLIIGTLNVFFRDINYIVQVFFQMFFYLTPIIYPISKIPEEYAGYMMLNPFLPIITCWRDVFLNGTIDMSYVLLAFLYSLVFLVVGTFTYHKLSWKFAEAM
ncbi:MAG: ABC transporter permease [Methylococcales bacterium]